MVQFKFVFEYIIYKRKQKNVQNYSQIGDIDHYSLHNIFIISVITESY